MRNTILTLGAIIISLILPHCNSGREIVKAPSAGAVTGLPSIRLS